MHLCDFMTKEVLLYAEFPYPKDRGGEGIVRMRNDTDYVFIEWE